LTPIRTRLRTGLDETFRSFGYRNFRLFFGGQLVSQIGNWLTLIGQSLFVLHLTDNNAVAVGVLTACQFLPVLVLGAWTGLVADRRDKRRLLIGVQLFAMLQSFALAALAFMGDPPLLAIYAVAMAGGIATAFDNPARRAFVVEMVSEDCVQNAVSLNSALMTGARVVGPALAGLLIVTTGYGWCFALDGVSYLAVVGALWRMRPAEMRAAAPAPRAKGQIRAGLRYMRAEPDLFVPLVMMAIVGTFAMNFAVVVPLFVKETLGGTDTTFTLLYSVVAIGSLIGALATARRTSISNGDVINGSLLFGASLVVLALVPSLVGAVPAAVFLGFASIVFMTATTATVQLRTLPEMRGRVLALQAMVFLGSTPIGGPILGVVTEVYGPRAGLLVGAAACFVAAAWGRAAVRRLLEVPSRSSGHGVRQFPLEPVAIGHARDPHRGVGVAAKDASGVAAAARGSDPHRPDRPR
jgi:MFS family permease